MDCKVYTIFDILHFYTANRRKTKTQICILKPKSSSEAAWGVQKNDNNNINNYPAQGWDHHVTIASPSRYLLHTVANLNMNDILEY